MKHLVYLLEDFEKKYNVPQGFFANNSVIVDNELGNDISDDWDYEKGKIIITGILHKDKIYMYVKEGNQDTEFKTAICRKLLDLGSTVPIHAFNKNFEIGNFKGDFDCEIEINEIKPFNAKGWTKDRFFEELRKRKKIPDIKMRDALGNDGGKCPGKWKEYIETQDFQHMMDIVSHNLGCLLKESVIMKHRDFFLNNWELDKRGFMLRELRG